MTTLKQLLSMLAVLALAACSGGGGSSGSSGFGGNGSGGGTDGGTTVAADLVLTLSSSTISNTGTGSVTATATAVNASRNTLANVPVTFTVDNNGVVTPAGTATDSSGAVTATIGIGSDTSLRTITVTATSGTITKTLPLVVTNTAGTGGSSTASLVVSLSATDVTSSTPATITATLRDTQGNAVVGQVVSLSTSRGTLAVPAVASLLTNAQGVATTLLRSVGSGVQGADVLIATATVGGANVQGQIGFNVQADAPTLSVSPSTQSIRFSTNGGSLSATARDAAGVPQAGIPVAFSAANGLVTLGAATVLTDAAGVATVTVKPPTPGSNGLEVVTASATVGGRSLSARANVQVVGEAPTVTVASVSSSAITTTTPATLRVVARDLQGNLLPNTVVTFRSTSGLVNFTPATQSTNAQGEASTVVAPVSGVANGADTVTASITVQSITASAQQVFQVSSSTPTGTPTLTLTMSNTSISAASPATVTATLKDAQGNGVSGQVVTFSVARGLGTTNIATALTQSAAPNVGSAIVLLSPTSATSAGADDVSATVSYGGTTLTRSLGFQVQATPVTLDSFAASSSPLGAYGQTNLTLNLTGATTTSPVSITVTSSCVALGKATLSPSSFTATSGSVTMQYRDNGCGAVQVADQLQAVVTATGTSRSLVLPITAPADSSIAFIQASPEQIYLRGSGFAENSVVTFEVRDAAGNPLPNRVVELRLLTGAGGVTMEGRPVESINPPSANPFTLTSNASGRVSARVNSGSLPTPVRVHARLADSTSIATVSSNLSVAVGLPSQLNFSFSQLTRNIEGCDVDGTTNTYQIIAADRNGNPVPAGTSVNFVTEGGQIEAIRQTQIVSGIARTTANFVSSEPRPQDCRLTVTAYALGEESFIDLNGNNSYDGPGSSDPLVPVAGEPFQDLGNIFKDRNFDGVVDADDEFISLTINNGAACKPITNPLLGLDVTIPTVGANTCDAKWSGAGQVYVRRALETVLSKSQARALWPNPTDGRLLGAGTSILLRTSSGPATTSFRVVSNDTICASTLTGAFNILVADANSLRLNPMAAGTTVEADTTTAGFGTAVAAGSPVPSTTSASGATITFNFNDSAVTDGFITLTLTSPNTRTRSNASVRVVRGATATALGCP